MATTSKRYITGTRAELTVLVAPRPVPAKVLASELRALAEVAACHPGELVELIEGESLYARPGQALSQVKRKENTRPAGRRGAGVLFGGR
jgi:hypothetical protein